MNQTAEEPQSELYDVRDASRRQKKEIIPFFPLDVQEIKEDFQWQFEHKSKH